MRNETLPIPPQRDATAADIPRKGELWRPAHPDVLSAWSMFVALSGVALQRRPSVPTVGDLITVEFGVREFEQLAKLLQQPGATAVPPSISVELTQPTPPADSPPLGALFQPSTPGSRRRP